ncbi:M48 family metallopeptidase [Prochlorothrix hollandica]|uniref:Peptidase M48 n=1 Tax=Prochlorothrix hollandica PCC 9006 = CALU 1027 TaxID=317619 RepID=A0A0M2PVP4_PROHO|nr:M48 family metallopeptidase [Prochlorothrix hollandica]KKI99167.1 peptidase M48 [Prochlorothrix hollandica PCC 9006 = CALU 1027]
MSIEVPAGAAAYRDDLTPPPKKRQLLVVFGLWLGILLALVLAVNALINQAVWWIPPQVEQQLGAAIAPAFEKLAQPSPAQDSLNQLLNRLEEEMPPALVAGRDYQVIYIPEDVVNAMAIPGDRVIIYQGLLAQVESENELMMVLGHELGHFAHRDHLRGLGRGIVLRLALATVFGDVGTLGAIAVSGAENLSNAQYSQSQETDADEFALDLLMATYGQGAGATDFFQRLSQDGGRGWDFWASHPNPDRRVQQIQRWIQEKGYAVGDVRSLPAALQVEP